MVCRRSAPEWLVLTQTVTLSAACIPRVKDGNGFRAKKNYEGRSSSYLGQKAFRLDEILFRDMRPSSGGDRPAPFACSLFLAKVACVVTTSTLINEY